MDCSVEYIKMCEKAVRIQEEFKELSGDFCFGRATRFEEVIEDIITPDQGEFCKYRDIIWLPRQDQLQKMVLNHGQHGYNNSGILVGLSIFAEANELNKASMEQLWLAFVMSEKFSKRWNGEEWVKV